jgi:3-oxoacyl-ACP reductase-like protein
MSIFGDIASKLFGHSTAHAAEAPAVAGQPAKPPGAAPAASPAAPPAAPSPAAPAPTAAPAAGAAVQGVDVTAILDGLVAKHHEKLDWRHSIVDLLKSLDLDSSLSARKELAAELHYAGDTGDSATMNVWLIKQVIAKLAANGGKLPPELLH